MSKQKVYKLSIEVLLPQKVVEDKVFKVIYRIRNIDTKSFPGGVIHITVSWPNIGPALIVGHPIPVEKHLCISTLLSATHLLSNFIIDSQAHVLFLAYCAHGAHIIRVYVVRILRERARVIGNRLDQDADTITTCTKIENNIRSLANKTYKLNTGIPYS